MDNIVVGILAFMVAVLAVLQGWQMVQHRKNSINPGTQLNGKLDVIITILGRMEQRLNDIWDKVNK